ncbi:MAG TPA: arginine--tRNA ligase, partial [Phycisphaerales bacterium]|nr:arginine--tRNA ligase [Phycisphaerales bacterium]
AGPGFINLRLKPNFIAASLMDIFHDPVRLAIEPVSDPKRTVVDFSSPNIAKEMHVGHLRSTILGDCICRVLAFRGHEVIRQNHIGDWGRQFGRVLLGLWHMCMGRARGDLYYEAEIGQLRGATGNPEALESLCRRIRDRHEEDWRRDSDKTLGDGERLFKPFLKELATFDVDEMWRQFLGAYQFVSALEDATETMDMDIPVRGGTVRYGLLSRHVTTMLQDLGRPENEQERMAWEQVRQLSLRHCDEIYRRLGITFDDDEIRGESVYHDRLGDVVKDLQERGLAVESDGAVCVFPEGFKSKEGEPLPLIVRKSDGAYLYATTDLAAVRYRVEQLKARRVVYVTDARQGLHFEMFFAVAGAAGWVGEDIDLVHVTFGSVLGEDGSPLKTRSGENVRLRDLLDEAVQRARAVVEQKNPDLSPDEKDRIARAVGIGAVKYADYSNNRTSDYVFSFERMLSLEGNTAPYLQYAYARIKSIEEKAPQKDVDVRAELAAIDGIRLNQTEELDLGKFLCRYGDAVEAAATDYRPNYLTAYLYELAQKFSAFYTNCPVLGAEPKDRAARLLLCELTARTIRHGLSDLLGIDVIERM